MRYVSRANRGMNFEELIKKALQVYQIKGEAVVTKQHTKFLPLRDASGRVVNAKVDEKATCDFMGRCGKIPVAFEAKSTMDNRILFSVVEDHQKRFLDDFAKDGAGVCFVAVSFGNLQRFFTIPWAYWKANMEICAASGTQKKLQKALIDIDGKKAVWTTGTRGINVDEIPPEWEIKTRAPYILPVLDILQIKP